jgi:hypothetical protein
MAGGSVVVAGGSWAKAGNAISAITAARLVLAFIGHLLFLKATKSAN